MFLYFYKGSSSRFNLFSWNYTWAEHCDWSHYKGNIQGDWPPQSAQNWGFPGTGSATTEKVLGRPARLITLGTQVQRRVTVLGGRALGSWAAHGSRHLLLQCENVLLPKPMTRPGSHSVTQRLFLFFLTRCLHFILLNLPQVKDFQTFK